MKTLSVVASLLVLCLALQASNDHRRDGNWWLNGSRFSYWGVRNDDTFAPKAAASYEEYGSKYLEHVTNSQLVDGLDTFYADYRNRKLRIPDGIWLVLNSVAGTPQQDLEKMIESFRKNAN
jgi:hypothetical protein